MMWWPLPDTRIFTFARVIHSDGNLTLIEFFGGLDMMFLRGTDSLFLASRCIFLPNGDLFLMLGVLCYYCIFVQRAQ